jgi:hypothetical protein
VAYGDFISKNAGNLSAGDAFHAFVTLGALCPMIPLNVESVFVVAGLLFVVLRCRGKQLPRAAWSAGRWDILALASLAIAVVLCFAWMAPSYFLSDDFVLLKLAHFPWRTRQIFTTGGGDGFFRPLGYFSYTLSARWADIDPARWHWIGFALHALNAMLVFALAGALGLPRFAGWFAGMLFAVYGANPEAVVWIAGRFDLLATFWVLAALIAWVRWIASGRTGWLAVAGISLLAGMLSKESAYSFPLLAALALLCSGGGRKRRAWAVLLGFFVLSGILFTCRWHLLGGIGGYGSISLAGSAKALLFRMWAILFFPVNWTLPHGGWLIAIAALYAPALAMLFSARADAKRILFALGFIAATAAPAVSLLLIGPDLEKARVLYLPAVGFCLLLATLAERLGPPARAASVAIVLLFHAAVLWHNLTGWRRASEIAQSACETAARCATPLITGLPRTWNGVYLFANGFPECVEMNRARGADESTLCRFAWDPARSALKPVVQ